MPDIRITDQPDNYQIELLTPRAQEEWSPEAYACALEVRTVIFKVTGRLLPLEHCVLMAIPFFGVDIVRGA